MHRRHAVLLALAAALLPLSSRAADGPPWRDPVDVPLPPWVRSVVPRRGDVPLHPEPGQVAVRRGTTTAGVRLPLFATRRGSGCGGRWMLVGPWAWVCSDHVDLSADAPLAPPRSPSRDGLLFRYFFAGPEGAYGYLSLATADQDAAEQELDRGFAVAIVDERTAHGERWGLTRKGHWVAMSELVPARPSTFRGAVLASPGELDTLAFVAQATAVRSAPRGGKAVGSLPRFTRVTVHAVEGAGAASMARVSAEGEPPRWVAARDLTRPTRAPRPAEVPSESAQRWIDVDLARQALVAYEGDDPVFATLVSTGRGKEGTATATPLGVHRIWVKLVTSTMDNVDDDDATSHYSIEDVPWVQFFDKGVALHAAFWHGDFGRRHSHGCVNLSPSDAEWLFSFTGPHLPAGWSAVLPSHGDRGTVVRVR